MHYIWSTVYIRQSWLRWTAYTTPLFFLFWVECQHDIDGTIVVSTIHYLNPFCQLHELFVLDPKLAQLLNLHDLCLLLYYRRIDPASHYCTHRNRSLLLLLLFILWYCWKWAVAASLQLYYVTQSRGLVLAICGEPQKRWVELDKNGPPNLTEIVLPICSEL